MSTFPDGLYEYGGVPVNSARFSSPWATHYFVDGIDGNDNNTGLKPAEAKATIQAAVTAASSQDIIYVRPLAPLSDPSDVGRYVEHVTVPYTTVNLSLIGVCPHYDPYYGPKLAGTNATGYTLDVRSPGFHMENILLHRRDSDTGGLRLTGQGTWATYLGSLGASIVHCILKGGPHIVTGGFNSIFYRCTWNDAPYGLTFSQTADDGSGAVAGRGHRVIDCDFLSGDGGTPTTTAYIRWLGAHYNFVVKRCYFEQ